MWLSQKHGNAVIVKSHSTSNNACTIEVSSRSSIQIRLHLHAYDNCLRLWNRL